MSTIDIILTCLLGFSAILGFFRGVSKGSIRFLSIVGAVLLAYYIGIPIAYGIMSTSLGSESLTMAYNSLLPQEGIFAESLVDLSYTSSQQLCSSALTELSFPTFFQGMFLSNIFVTTSTVGVAISSSFAYWTLLAIFFIVFLVILLVLFRFLFNTILGPILGKDGRGIVGRILGAVRGFLKMRSDLRCTNIFGKDGLRRRRHFSLTAVCRCLILRYVCILNLRRYLPARLKNVTDCLRGNIEKHCIM